MDRIIHSTAVDIGSGKRGFRSKDTVAGLPGTVVTAGHMNALQEEILAVIEAADIDPDPGDLTQLLQAIRKLLPRGRQAYYTAGTYNWTVPAWVTRIHAEVIGGGGSGGSISSGFYGGAGGGGGYEEGWFDVTPGTVLAITVGAGGAGAIAAPGNNGGTSFISGLLAATGGLGGTGNGSATLAGGVSGTGTLNNLGLGDGGTGGQLVSGAYAPGTGGGPGGQTGAQSGYPGKGPGGGGGGAGGGFISGPGHDGSVVIHY
jgi:hypothetical protein